MEKQSSSYRLPLSERLPRPLGALLTFSWPKLIFALFAGLLLGQQIIDPTGRVIKALAGIVLFIAAYRAQPFWALCFIAVMFMFPFGIFVGSSTMIFIVLASIVYLARLTLGQVPALRGTPVDAAVGLLAGIYILSFYNIDDPVALHRGLLNLVSIIASFMLFYMTANFIRTEDQLRKFVNVMMIATALVAFVGLYELFFPGKALIPGYILHTQLGLHAQTSRGYRVGGPIGDYELYGEYMALSFFLAFYLQQRASNANERFFGGALALLCIFMMLTTVTRGAVVSFMLGLVYLLWAIRRHVKFRDLVTVMLAGTFLYLGMEFVLINFTRSGSVLDRLLQTTFVGVVPDSRVGWHGHLERALRHPLIGHGPYFDLGRTESVGGGGLYTYSWPHNQYLFYLHTVGIPGTLAFVFILAKLYYVSFRTKAAELQQVSYARGLMVILNTMLVVFAVDQIKIDYLRHPTYQYYPWLILGMIAATHRIIKEQESKRAPPPT